MRPKRRSGVFGDDYEFSNDQPWVKNARSLSFVNETEDIISLNRPASEASSSSTTASPPPTKKPRCQASPRSRSWSPRPIAAAAAAETFSSSPSAASAPIVPASSWDGISYEDQVSVQAADHHRHHDHQYDANANLTPEAVHVPASPTTAATSTSLQGSTTTHLDTDIADNNALHNPITESSSDIPHSISFSHLLNPVRSSTDLVGPHPPPPPALPLNGFTPGLGSPPTNLEAEQQQEQQHHHTSSAASAPYSPGSEIYLSTPQWPLRDAKEAHLMRYYIHNISPQFDMCDGDRHFGRVVPLRAAMCPPLLNAILAAAAKRLSRIDNYDESVVDLYHNKCLEVLIPALSNLDVVEDENLLTAIVILRYVEELDVPISAPAPESHLIGTRVLLGAQASMYNYTGLRLAAFWLALRQEIYMAFVHARSVHANFALIDRDWMLNNSGDESCKYANRIILHCADCLRFCYDPEDQSTKTWEQLRRFQQDWWDNRPWFFQPIFEAEADEGAAGAGGFPKEVHLSDATIMGVQHYYLARMLLTAHDPNVPKLGPGRIAAFRRSDLEIKAMVRTVCGIAVVSFTVPIFDDSDKG